LLTATLQRFVQCDEGSTAIEYGLIAALVGLGIVVSLTSFKDGFGTLMNYTVTTLNGR
jgi:pilus assembly protein Flp/PilA